MARLITVIPVFNGERHLAETLRAVANQSIRPDRLIVLDNCSTDGTREIVANFRNLPCEWRQNETNIGLLNNLNRALEFGRETEFFHLLLADDLILPRFYETVLGLLESCPGRGIAYSTYEIVDENGRPIAPTPDRIAPQIEHVPLNRFLAAQLELRTILVPAVLLKTSHQPPPVVFPVDLPQVADSVFYAEWAPHCQKIVHTTEVLCQYRRHAASSTDRNMLNLQAWVLDEWKAMQRIATLFDESPAQKWLRQQKLKCLFAARSRVKIRLMQDQNPNYAQQIHGATRQITGPLHQWLGDLAVGARETYRYVTDKTVN